MAENTLPRPAPKTSLYLRLFVLMLAASAPPPQAHATVYNITETLPGESYFQTPVLHTSPYASNPMYGEIFVKFDEMTGTYNDAGELMLTLTLGGVTKATMTGSGFSFDSAGLLQSTANLTLTLLDSFSHGPETYAASTQYELTFTPGRQCCGQFSFYPNTLFSDTGESLVMSLWGAGTSLASGQRVGTDLQFRLEAVPLPAAVWLFISAIVGFVVIQRRRLRHIEEVA